MGENSFHLLQRNGDERREEIQFGVEGFIVSFDDAG